MAAEIRDIAPGLWTWRAEHPDWEPGAEWKPLVASTYVESRGEIAVIDPIAPPDDADEVWARLDADPPTVLAALKPDHVRDVDRFASRFGSAAYGPSLFWPHNVPEIEIEIEIEPWAG